MLIATPGTHLSFIASCSFTGMRQIGKAGKKRLWKRCWISYRKSLVVLKYRVIKISYSKENLITKGNKDRIISNTF
jgi:hypothetical protein